LPPKAGSQISTQTRDRPLLGFDRRSKDAARHGSWDNYTHGSKLRELRQFVRLGWGQKSAWQGTKYCGLS